MYNRYLTAAQQNSEPEPPAGQPHRGQRPHGEQCRDCGARHAPQECGQTHAESTPGGGLLSALGRRLTGFHLDADTLVVLAVIWFVLNDNEEAADNELLAAIGVLLLLGL